MPGPPLILLPPSEGKAPGGDGPPWKAGTMAIAELDRRRSQILRSLRGRPAVRSAPTLPAIERYTGVLYGELDAVSLSAADRARLDQSVLIVSGLWGLVSPGDPIPFYKLKMSGRVEPIGRLTPFWRPAITAALAPRAADSIVWDLLPIEHAAAVDWTRLDPSTRVTARFVDSQGKTVSHWNKLLKGSLVRWLVAERPAGEESLEAALGALESFVHPQGYRFDPQATVVEGSHVAITFRGN